jgi:hypothetical protein
VASAAAPLLAEIKTRFYPFVTERGFVRQKSSNPLLTEFRRELSQRRDVFEIQWDKYWRPFFVLNFGRDVSGGEAGNMQGRLQRGRCGDLCCWFSLRRPWTSKLRTGKWNYSPDEVVCELICAFDELETWWSGGEAGPHIYVYELHAKQEP